MISKWKLTSIANEFKINSTIFLAVECLKNTQLQIKKFFSLFSLGKILQAIKEFKEKKEKLVKNCYEGI